MQPRPPYSPIRRDTVRVPVIWFATALSLVLHALALFAWLPQFEAIKLDQDAADDPSRTRLTVQIAPERQRAQPQPQPQSARPPSVAQVQPPPPRRGLPEPPRVRPPSPPAAVPFNRPTPYKPAPPDKPAVKPPPAPEGDFAAMIEQRRRERGETTDPRAALSQEIAPPQPQESEEARRQRIVAANLGLDRAPSFGGDPRSGGGIFQITRMNYADAEFVFFGWNKDVKRNTRQRIEVAKGDNASIELAVVRRMIGIIREHEKGDFTWVSHRLGREVTLSARPGDSAGLEDFLMREFYMTASR